MALLLYCVALESSTDTTVTGVGGAAVSSVVHGGVRLFFSIVATDALNSRDVVTAARHVHDVVADIFSRTAVLPFRYPTVLADDAELSKLAAERGEAFRKFLERVGGKVQMDVRLTIEADHQGGDA